MELYHREVKKPSGWNDSDGYSINLEWSNHAKSEASKDGIPQAKRLTFYGNQVFEWGLENNKLIKLAVRVSTERDRDIILVITKQGKVITCWTNNKFDRHSTLDKSKYIH